MSRTTDFINFKLALTALLATTLVASTRSFADESQARDATQSVAKVFSLQAESKTKLADTRELVLQIFEVKYIAKNGEIQGRKIKLYALADAPSPSPLVYVPHYETDENSADTRAFLEKGWRVASPCEFIERYNSELAEDDLVFNCAALYALRNMPEIDRQRIALVGGSAGGYMTLMLDALQLGNCASIANSPITNLYFNIHQFFRKAVELNEPYIGPVHAKLQETFQAEGQQGVVDLFLKETPISYVAMIYHSFMPILDSFPDVDDYDRWLALSPVGLADCFSSPIVVNHYTADMLVPVDQITRRFTYPKEGETVPEGFSSRLPETNPGALGRSLEDELDKETTRAQFFQFEEKSKAIPLPYDPEKLVSVNIYDDGPTEKYASHVSGKLSLYLNPVDYFSTMFDRTLGGTERLSRGKLRLLLLRYAGKSPQLPPRAGVDDEVYGSLAIYRQEIVDELSEWLKNNSRDEYEKLAAEVVSSEKDAVLAQTLEEAREELAKELR